MNPPPQPKEEEDHLKTKTTESHPDPPSFIPKRLRHHLPEHLREGRASVINENNRITITMYPSYVHTGITAMAPRCSTADLDLQNALDSPTKETWILNHHKLHCLACLWSPSDRQQTGSPKLENKSTRKHVPRTMFQVHAQHHLDLLSRNES
jgi:hypothetical protein